MALPTGSPRAVRPLGGVEKGSHTLSCLNRQMRKDRTEDPDPLRNPTREALFDAIKVARETCIQAVWEEVALAKDTQPRRDLIRLLEIVAGEEEQALLPEKQTAYRRMLFERRRQEYDTRMEHMVFLMHKADRVEAAYHAHFHPDAAQGEGGKAPRRCAHSIGILKEDDRVYDLLEDPRSPRSWPPPPSPSPPCEEPTVDKPSGRPLPPAPPAHRVGRAAADELYQEDTEWDEYMHTGHLSETDGSMPPHRNTAPKAGPHIKPQPKRWAPPKVTQAAIEAGKKYHRDAMKVVNERERRYQQKQAKDFYRSRKKDQDDKRLAALNTETYNELFNVPATGRPIISNFQLSQTRQLFDFNPKAEAVAAHGRAVRENRVQGVAPIYPVDYGVYGK